MKYNASCYTLTGRLPTKDVQSECNETQASCHGTTTSIAEPSGVNLRDHALAAGQGQGLGPLLALGPYQVPIRKANGFTSREPCFSRG